MTLNRGVLARIDRAILAALGHEREIRLVKLPLSEATWSTWRRYCDAIGIPMGHAIAALVEHELRFVVEVLDERPIFLSELERTLAERQQALDARERSLAAREQRLEADLLAVRVGSGVRVTPARFPKVGRNDLCPCASGLKYKRCHGRG